MTKMIRECLVNGDEICTFPIACPRHNFCRKYKEPVYPFLEKMFMGILTVALLTELVTTPEQRAEWTRKADWNYHASKYTD